MSKIQKHTMNVQKKLEMKLNQNKIYTLILWFTNQSLIGEKKTIRARMISLSYAIYKMQCNKCCFQSTFVVLD
jgi:hypothetical protein